ncbi:TetR family transcriptional regulator [Sandaracinobacter sp. RS1-74]|uniref:TetR/AcrR family transcriptional regulator n=1 Tax=Sandaracinobacteroides sayramensis TaxID=2913411 RepID=UPI001ED9F081|nr:TetR family transcriptional regulator [Sandaracinobacteroides sayramensis]MCG2842424.1 TetR family transcriptional regulator [Sandaracinobacteroides sayramensis]
MLDIRAPATLASLAVPMVLNGVGGEAISCRRRRKRGSFALTTSSRSRTQPGPRGLSKSVLVEAAIALMEEVGENAFTLRKLGARVGCDAMAILYHFKSKDGLFHAMADWMETRLLPSPAQLPWRERLRHLADQYRSLALRYPNSFPLMQRFASTGHADYGHMEMVHEALEQAGIPVQDIPTVCIGWYAAITGLAVGEVAGLVRPLTATEADEIERLPADRYPRLKAAIGLYRELAPEAVFSGMMEQILDGIDAHGRTASENHVSK